MKWLQQLLDAARPSQADLARHLDIKPPRVFEMINGTRRLQPNEIKPTAEFFGLPIETITDMMGGDEEAIRAGVAHAGNKAAAKKRPDDGGSQPPAVEPAANDAGRESDAPYPQAPVTYPPIQPGRPDVPVWASAQAGNDGAMVLVNDPIDWIRRSERMQGVKAPFAFYVIGQSMSPAIDHGDQVIVNPSLLPEPNKDHVFLQTQEDGTILAMVKRLLRVGGTSWKVRQFNPEKDFDLPKSKWAKALRITEKRLD